MMKKLGACLAVALLLATAACGSSRPSADDVSKALQKGAQSNRAAGQSTKLTKKQSDCAGKIFVDSKVSDAALKALVAGNQKYKESKADDAALQKVIPQLKKCVA